ncbi:MAG: protein kinase, partial [Planctomycetota bacterium]
MASRPRDAASSPPTASEGRTLFLAARDREREQKATFLAVEGSQVGDFSLLRLLGRGGMGEVWEAQQRSLKRRVALKLILPDRVDERSLEFFAREARAGGRLHHPGIVSVHDYGRAEDVHWISLELIDDAVDLRRALETLKGRGRLPRAYAREVAAFAAELADALQHAHEG